MTRRSAWIGLLAPFAVACWRGGATQLQGHWHGVRAEGVSTEAAGIANAFAAGMELDVRGDSMTVTTAGQHKTGRYRVLRDDTNRVVLTTDLDGPTGEQTFMVTDPDTLKWAVQPGKWIVFTRE
jgi:hypothetical protein